MVAETLTGARGGSTVTAFKPPAAGGLVCAAYGSYAIAANVEAGDIFELCWVPAGAVLLGGYLYLGDMDTGIETLDMDVGWAANGGSGTYDAADSDGLGNLGVLTGDAFANPSVSPVAGNVVPLSGLFATGVLPFFTKKTKIQTQAVAAAATFAAQTHSVVVFYVVDESLAA